MSRREWDEAKLNIAAAKQDDIAKGDIVRSYDFPGMRDDCYIEGVVITREQWRVLIHVTRDVYQGQDEQVGGRLQVHSPLGVSSMTDAPCVFLVAKCKLRNVS